MKKYPFVWMLFLLILLSVFPKKEDKLSLANTVWQQTKNESTTYILAFGNGVCSYQMSDRASNVTIKAEYTYSLYYPTIFFIPTQSGYPRLKGNISGKTISLLDKQTKKTIAILTSR